MSYVAYIVRPGDCLDRISFRFGLSPEDVLAFPKNADLSREREDLSMLVAGDLLYLPRRQPGSQPLHAGATNEYKANVPTVDVNLRLVDRDEVLAGEPYTVEGPEGTITGTTDSEGRLSFPVAVTERTATIYLTKRGTLLEAVIGGLDPVDTPTGVQMRLSHLGFYGGPVHDRITHHVVHAIKAFQSANRLPLTGEADAATRAKLVARHGS